MTALKQTSQASSIQAPLNILADALHDDMNNVNDIILNQIGSDVPDIQEIAKHLIAAGGKRIRPLMTLAAARIFSNNIITAQPLAAAVEFIHSATLLHDDVVDESAQRRGKDTANNIYGNAVTVLVGDFLFSRAFQLMISSNNMLVLKALSDATAIIAEGEVMQLSAVSQLDLSLEQYEAIISAKTAALFAAACEVGARSAGADENQAQAMKLYGHHLGIAFQMSDDLLDYDPARETLGKDPGDDFREGKPTLPVILCRDTNPEFWDRTIAQKDQQDGDFEQAQRIIQDCDALNRGHALARQHADKAIAALNQCPSGMFRDTLADLTEYVIQREN